jgi:hypothetical protein
MKKIFTLIGVLAVSLGVSAQRIPVTYPSSLSPVTDLELQSSRDASHHASVSERGGTIFFQEDFSNGLDGSNGIGPLVIDDSGDDTIWMMATGDSPAGQFSSNLASMDSPTADNGWIIFDCDLYNTPVSSGVEDVVGSLTIPSLDCSSKNSVIVEYYQYFRYCCFPMSPLTLEVSTNGGTSWIVYPAHGSFFPSANTLSANPLLTRVDISCAAAGEPNVLIRWGYNLDEAAGYSHYFWGIDDISIYENPIENDLEVVQTLNGDVWNLWEYRVTPFEQRTLTADGGLLAGVVYRNNGYANQDGTTITVEILDSEENVLHTETSDPFLIESFANTEECPSYLLDTLYFETGWEPSTIGTYTIRASIASLSEDELPENDSATRVIVYTDCQYGHEDEADLTGEARPRESEDDEGEFDPTGYGSFFTFPNENSTAHGISVVFGTNTDVGAEFNAVLYQTNGSLNDSGEIIASEEYYTTEGQLNDEYHYYPFDESAEVEVEETYFAAVLNDSQSPFELTVSVDLDSDSDNSTGVYERSGSDDFVWFQSQTWSPAVRLILCEQVGVEEIVNDQLLTFFSISPNPASDIARISYQVAGSTAVAYEVRDIAGRLVEYSNLGRVQPGMNTLNLNVSNYAAGTYTVGIVVDNARMFAKQLQVVR